MSDEHEVALRLRAVVCDGPAKFKVSHMKGHTSSHGCCFCMQIGGKKIAADGKKKGAVLFWAERGDPIVSAMYSTRYPPEHYQADIFERFSPLELIGIDMIYDLVLDCMHLFDLGIVKKIVDWLLGKGGPRFKLTIAGKQHFKEVYDGYKTVTPCEFGRKPVDFDKVSPKATDYRRIVHYHGLELFKIVMPDDQFQHFLLLYCAAKLLSDDLKYAENAPLAQQFLDKFVCEWPEFYGDELMHYTLHMLLHVTQFIERLGPMYSWSAYKYESMIGEIHNHLHSMNLPLSQLNRRIREKGFVQYYDKKRMGLSSKKITETIPGYENVDVYRSIQLEKLKLSVHEADSYFQTESGKCAKFLGAYQTSAGDEYVIFKEYLDMEPAFLLPLNSLEYFGVFVSGILSHEIKECVTNNVKCKYFMHPSQDKQLFQPIIHSTTNQNDDDER